MSYYKDALDARIGVENNIKEQLKNQVDEETKEFINIAISKAVDNCHYSTKISAKDLDITMADRRRGKINRWLKSRGFCVRWFSNYLEIDWGLYEVVKRLT